MNVRDIRPMPAKHAACSWRWQMPGPSKKKLRIRRATQLSAWKTTIAHGFLTLSLLTHLDASIPKDMSRYEGVVMGVVWLGILALLLSPLAWGSGSLYSSHRAVLPRRPLTATGIQMICGGSLLLVGAVLVGELRTFDVAAVSTRSWLGLLYLTTVGSLVGFTTYVWLLRVAPLPKIATYAYVNPVVAFVLAGILLGEPIEPRTVVAGGVIVFAVALIVTARSRLGGAAAEAGPAEVALAADPTGALGEVEPNANPTAAPGDGLADGSAGRLARPGLPD